MAMTLVIVGLPVILGVFPVACVHSSLWMGGYISEDYSERAVEYVYYKKRVSWNEARTVCQSIGGDLAKVNSQSTLDMLIEYSTEKYSALVLRDDFWIGLSEYLPGQFSWVVDCSYVDFSSNYMDPWKDNHHCFLLKPGSDYIGERKQCKDGFPFLCERRPARLCNFFPFIQERRFVWLADVSGLGECEYWCAMDSTCEAAMFVAPSDCYSVAEETGAQTSDVTMIMASKFCMEFDVNTTDVNPSQNDDIIPNTACGIELESLTSVPPSNSPVSLSTVPPSISPSPTQAPSQSSSICSTLFVPHTISPSPSSCLTPTQTLVETLMTTVEITPQCEGPTTIVSTTTVVSEPICSTSTVSVQPTSSLTRDEVTELAEKISRNLSVNTKSTSYYLRRLTSASDPRKTSVAIGAVGVAGIVIPLAIIMAADMKRLLIFTGWLAQGHIDV